MQVVDTVAVQGNVGRGEVQERLQSQIAFEFATCNLHLRFAFEFATCICICICNLQLAFAFAVSFVSVCGCYMREIEWKIGCLSSFCSRSRINGSVKGLGGVFSIELDPFKPVILDSKHYLLNV